MLDKVGRHGDCLTYLSASCFAEVELWVLFVAEAAVYKLSVSGRRAPLFRPASVEDIQILRV